MEENKGFSLSAVWNQQLDPENGSKPVQILQRNPEPSVFLGNTKETTVSRDVVDICNLKRRPQKRSEHSALKYSEQQDIETDSSGPYSDTKRGNGQTSSEHNRNTRPIRNPGDESKFKSSIENISKSKNSCEDIVDKCSLKNRPQKRSEHSALKYSKQQDIETDNSRFYSDRKRGNGQTSREYNRNTRPSLNRRDNGKPRNEHYENKFKNSSENISKSKNSCEETEQSQNSKYLQQTKVTKPASFSFLQVLITKPPNEILISINGRNSSFMLLLEQEDMRPDMVALALIAMGKSCMADLNQSISSLINSIQSNSDFLLVSIPKYLVGVRQIRAKPFHFESLFYLIVFLQKFQHTMPSSSSDKISILLPLLTSICDKFLCTHELYSDAKKKLKEIDEQNDEFLRDHTPSEVKKISHRENQNLLEPPENYRTISVLPNADDIHLPQTFLRPNVVEGKYLNTEHYLDVQYRLLREDYVRPLREGIADYLKSKNQSKYTRSYKDVRVYQNVHIVKQDFVNGGIVHIAQFPKNNFSHVKWEYSKRFLTGSLLCFSSDDFQTMLFASIARRVPEELKKGLLLIRFEKISDEVLNLSPLRSFVVIETSAYFEAYRYNLKALHELNEENLPLKKYIVDVEEKVDCPSYLNDGTTYDMRPLLLPLDEKYMKRSVDIGGDIRLEYEFPPDIRDKAVNIRILNDASWPTESDLNLDHSQYLALKAAVTREFAVIQGPPGTGKTYIGLRIVQLLLHNINKWFVESRNSLPILVVCFTNHALDQFLEGLMLFTDKIVRIGGQGTNEAVSKFQLSNLKRIASAKKEIPKYISFNLWRKHNDLKSLKHEIDIKNKNVQKSLTTVLGESEMKNCIPDSQYASLKRIRNDPSFKFSNLTDDGFLIHDWLGVRFRMGEWVERPHISKVKEEIAQVNATTTNVGINFDEDYDGDESDGEADIEFIEAQRNIDSEDFADVSFDLEVPEEENVILPDDDPGWQVQGGKKRREKYIKNCLQNAVPFEESKAMKIKNLWAMSIPHRWQLYKFWLVKYIAEKQKECMDLQLELKKQFQEMCEMRTEQDVFLLQKANVVGMTTTGAAKYRDIVLRLNPQILVVEEAAEILESHIVTSLAPKTQHVILIGDHQQLRPSPTVHALAVKYDLNVSLFERMIKNKMDCFRLSIQHRMRPDIADLITPHIYKDLKNHDAVTKFENIKGVGKNVFFITHSYNELPESDSKSKVNEHEAKFLIKLCKYFILQGYDPSQITVLTTYTGQLFVLKRLVTDVIRKVRFTVVDNFQGEENDIILVSLVRSNEEGEIGFLKVANRVCVALSRARKGLYCIGNFELLAEKSGLWKNIISTLQEKQAIGPSLQLMCQNHPGVCSIVANENDFESVPEGGCTRVCEYRLACGHVCSLLCHPYDKDHEFVRCYKECNKTCDKGHKCRKKCHEKCGRCTYLLDKKIYSCGHTVKVHCYKSDEEVECSEKCSKSLPCGHDCPNLCRETCAFVCKKLITVTSPICGHQVTIECCFASRPDKLIENCRNPCKSILECGHVCRGNCARCHQGRLHVACNNPCKRVLVCGHECNSPCSKSCPPCRRRCENRCIHSRCPKKCGEPCEECTERCAWSCIHKKCSRLCGETCNRVPCSEPCPVLLPCSHFCIGFCGEPCPEECRECNGEIVKEIFFGTEDDEDARFVRLEDCNHIFEISGLTQWMKTDAKVDSQIQMKVCPKCKTVIRTNLRFGNVVKDCLKKIEKVKRITYGNIDKNKEIQGQLLKCLKKSNFIFQDVNNGSQMYKSWESVLSSKKCRSVQELTTMENTFLAFVRLASALNYSTVSLATQDSSVKEGIDVLSRFMDACKSWLFEFIQDEYLTASEQQLHQLTWEAHRLKLSKKLIKLAKEHTIKSCITDFEKCISLLINYAPFGDDDMKAFSNSFRRLAESCGSAVINVSDLEKDQILKAMNLAKGHWYQCPNGHVYCITECGGAMEKSRCNECNAEIGGASHTLLRTNRVATDMDGARHAAWSEAMNINNYRFQDRDDDEDEYLDLVLG